MDCFDGVRPAAGGVQRCHYSSGVRYEHTLQNRKNIIEDEDVLINGVSAGCAVWMNYADFAGVKCDVRFGLYL